ncbi:hypothetical protein SNE40_006118 [Patella caerulea]|uniref:Uncharacterized protein n=1 Tax=Patella caerulea TaxID=87958 RepID=A0AAN8Q439_PATCE
MAQNSSSRPSRKKSIPARFTEFIAEQSCDDLVDLHDMPSSEKSDNANEHVSCSIDDHTANGGLQPQTGPSTSHFNRDCVDPDFIGFLRDCSIPQNTCTKLFEMGFDSFAALALLAREHIECLDIGQQKLSCCGKARDDERSSRSDE